MNITDNTVEKLLQNVPNILSILNQTSPLIYETLTAITRQLLLRIVIVLYLGNLHYFNSSHNLMNLAIELNIIII